MATVIESISSAAPEAWSAFAEAALAQGDLVTAALLLDSHDAAHAAQPDLVLLASRVLRLRGHYPDARAALERALERHPDHAGLLVERARLACAQRDAQDALDWFERAWAQTGEFAAWAPEWLDLLIQSGRHETALAVAQTHAGRAQDDADAWFWLGYVQQLNQQHAAALNAYHRCAGLAPNRPMLRSNLAALYLDQRDYAAAKTQLDLALKADPGNALAWANLSVLWLKRGDPAAARIAAERALALNPRHAIAWQGYSNALKELQDWTAATEAIERACALEPQHASYRWSLAMLQLVRGDYANGWTHHEARWQGSPELRTVQLNWSAPRLADQDVAGKTVLVWSEQGYGDVLQFARFVPAFAQRVREAGGEVAYCTFPNLLPLVSRSLAGRVEQIAPSLPQAIPPHDYQLPLGSLPLALDVSLDALSGYAPPYLKADAAQTARWRNRCASAGARLKVGLVWSGSRTHQRNAHRSVPPSALARALAGIEQVQAYNLQVEATRAELEAIGRGGLALIDHTKAFKTFDETAAFVSQLDLVITVCTSIAHLAGALNVPTWVLLDVNPHWVWLTDRDDSPWYPSMRLYRQPAFGAWQPVLQRLGRDLRARAAACETAPDAAGTT
ncbi:tetratricopeptide repeat protein [Burkholderia singularis]|uniref:FOG: TPR repeat n=1 Tax=Burkholderia singularis TaxID=1503053 RepID=A0A238HBR9_9BURK|nr:tetratricopeptide repeat protein [Burkholderia singularis]SMG02475.1 FOG: TPR repeat [Burkholderia singularis]